MKLSPQDISYKGYNNKYRLQLISIYVNWF